MAERRRLHLVGKPVETEPLAQRVRAPGQAIGIVDSTPPSADATPAQGALTWATELALALAETRPGLRLCALAFEAEPVLPSELVERLEAAGVRTCAYQIRPGPDALDTLCARLGAASQGLWLCVGEPAVAWLDPWLSVIVGSDVPIQRWLPSLRPHAESASLWLPTSRTGLARTLAAQLSAYP
jgi:hypothetical protein